MMRYQKIKLNLILLESESFKPTSHFTHSPNDRSHIVIQPPETSCVNVAFTRRNVSQLSTVCSSSNGYDKCVNS